MIITEVNLTPVKPTGGLVAFASCVIDDCLYVGSLGIHKRLDGKGYRLTYPTKKLGGHQLNYYHPINREAGAAIEQAVFAKCDELFERSDEPDDRHSKATDDHTKPTNT